MGELDFTFAFGRAKIYYRVSCSFLLAHLIQSRSRGEERIEMTSQSRWTKKTCKDMQTVHKCTNEPSIYGTKMQTTPRTDVMQKHEPVTKILWDNRKYPVHVRIQRHYSRHKRNKLCSVPLTTRAFDGPADLVFVFDLVLMSPVCTKFEDNKNMAMISDKSTCQSWMYCKTRKFNVQ